MRAIYLFVLLFAVAMTYIACEKDSTVSVEPTAEKSLKTRSNDVDLCHYSDDDNTWHVISVNQNAVQAHLNHGDVVLVDADGDGWVAAENECVPGGDCDDNDASVNPDAEEVCDDGIDNNCDGEVDEGCLCYDEIFCGDIISGSTIGQSSLPNFGCNWDGAADWYSFTGTGATVTFSTCSPNSDYDTYLAIYTGSDCENGSDFVCVAANDDNFDCTIGDFSWLTSEITITLVEGEKYNVHLGGFVGGQGNYELSISCGENISAPPTDELNVDSGEITIGDVHNSGVDQGYSLDVSVGLNTTGVIQVTDQNGKMVSIEKVRLNSGQNTVPLKLDDVRAGNYDISISIGANQFYKVLNKER